MRKRAAAIIINDRKILMIHRHKEGREYWVLPGGGIEDDETPEQAVVREVMEETSLTVDIVKALDKFTNDPGHEHYTFICNYKGGEARFASDSPEILRKSPDNTYELTWVRIDEIENLNIFPEKNKEQIISSN